MRPVGLVFICGLAKTPASLPTTAFGERRSATRPILQLRHTKPLEKSEDLVKKRAATTITLNTENDDGSIAYSHNK